MYLIFKKISCLLNSTYVTVYIATYFNQNEIQFEVFQTTKNNFYKKKLKPVIDKTRLSFKNFTRKVNKVADGERFTLFF